MLRVKLLRRHLLWHILVCKLLLLLLLLVLLEWFLLALPLWDLLWDIWVLELRYLSLLFLLLLELITKTILFRNCGPIYLAHIRVDEIRLYFRIFMRFISKRRSRIKSFLIIHSECKNYILIKKFNLGEMKNQSRKCYELIDFHHSYSTSKLIRYFASFGVTYLV